MEISEISRSRSKNGALGVLRFEGDGDLLKKSAAASKAMMSQSKEDTSGIDLNPAQMRMQIKKEGDDFKFNFNGTEINASQVTGAMFTIRTMTPVIDLPLVWD